MRKIAAIEGGSGTPGEPPAFKVHRLEGRLCSETVGGVMNRYEDGESATGIAKNLGVAPSPLLRLLAQKLAVVRKHGLASEQDAILAREHEAGATMAELEKKHQISHGAVLRTLRRIGVTMRPIGRMRKAA